LLHQIASFAAKEKMSSEVLSRMFSFQEKYNPQVKGNTLQVYTKHYYETYRRNLLLWLIPSMYNIAGGQRQFMSEQYDLITIQDANRYDRKRQVYYTTIPKNRETMSVLDNFSTPNLYSPTLYGKFILSPFCRENRYFYRYKVSQRGKGQARIDFRPRLGDNTQLVSGTAIVEAKTGRIHDVVIKGEYDMIDFYTTIKQDNHNDYATNMPKYCKTDVNFKFAGNNIASSFTSVFNCPTQLPDTINIVGNRKLMEKIRPIQLTKKEKQVYAKADSVERSKRKEVPTDSTQQNMMSSIKELGWDVGSYLLSSHETGAEKYHIKLSPIIEPQYISYSQSRGLSYKLKFSADYNISPHSDLYFSTTLGYNFKIRKVYANIPLRYVYNKRKDNYVELAWNVGNRVGNSAILDELKKEYGDLPELEDIDLYDDNEISLRNFTQIMKGLRLELGMVYHRRSAVNESKLKSFNKPDLYQSLAPSIGLHLTPWKKGPSLSINYERTINNHYFDLDYERWETSLSEVFPLPSTKLINLQIGGGLYTRRSTNSFMDFSNFCVNNLQGGWDDNWAGDFQLLNSNLYNISHYYVSTNISYETPLLFTSFIPVIGRYIERERFYWSGLLIEYNRPYHELGYGFTTRFFSVGLFSSFHELDFQQFGVKFTLELFHRW
jgi:hypothetical protein